MSKPDIIEKQPITVSELKSILKSLKKRDEELSFRAGKAEDYVNHVSSLAKKDVDELKKKIAALEIPRLKDDHITKMIDLLPRTVAEAKVILQGYTLTVSADNLNKILGVLKDYLPTKK